jgi:vacuolar iron transporter family protein
MEHAHPGEQHRNGLGSRLNWLRAGVLGANDGIVSVAGLVVGNLVGITGSALLAAVLLRRRGRAHEE